jgi:zinc transport system ATP-binding protein
MDATNTHEQVVRVEKVTKKFGDHIALNNISFDISRGDVVGVIGPNGAGKSTLANILLGFDPHYTGRVSLSKKERISYVPQFSRSDTHSLPLSVREFLKSAANTFYGIKDAAHEDTLVKTLDHVGLGEHYLEQNVYSLSGGERQRTLIARALLGDPTFLVLDEPLASVDYAARDSLYALLKHLNQTHHITMLLISHDVESIVTICDSILCINKTLHQGCHPESFALGKETGQAVHHTQHTS